MPPLSFFFRSTNLRHQLCRAISSHADVSPSTRKSASTETAVKTTTGKDDIQRTDDRGKNRSRFALLRKEGEKGVMTSTLEAKIQRYEQRHKKLNQPSEG